MTVLGKIIVSLGIGIFTASTLTWIITGDWRWFVGGAAIFVASLATSAVVSAETKPSSPPRQSFRSSQNDRDTREDTAEYPIVNEPSVEEWAPPPTPPPDQEDPFSRPARQ